MIPREDWPALLTISVVVLLANVVAYSIRGSVNLPGRSLMYMTIFAVPVGLVAAAGVNYALYGDPLLQLHNRS